MAGPFDSQLIQQLNQYAQQLNTGQAAGIGSIGQVLSNPMADLQSLVSSMGTGYNPPNLSMPKPMAALNAAPPDLGPRFAAGASGVDDLFSAGSSIGRNLPVLASQVSNATRAAEPVANVAGGIGGLGKYFKNPLAGGGGVKGLIGKSLPGLGVSIAGNYIGNEIGGDVGSLISGASTGAGLGMMFGPWGAAVGGVAGGLLSLLDNDDEANPEEKLISFIQQAQLPDEKKASYLLQYEILRETTGDEKAALQTVGQQIVTDMANAEQAQEQQQKMLASQALTAQFFQPFTQQLLDSAQQRAKIGEQLAGQLPDGYRQIAQMQNAASLDNATRTANAYAAQAQILPAFEAMQQQQQMANQLAQQQTAQVMQQVAGGNAAGGGGLASLIQQLGG